MAAAPKKGAQKPKRKPAKAAKPKPKAPAKTAPAPAPAADPDTGAAELASVIARYRGRPTKYDPAFCEPVIAWGALGKSRTWIAAEMMVTRNTLDNWAKENPDFLSALETAKQLEQQCWEDEGQKGMKINGFGGSIWSRNMAARFPSEWTERKDRTITLETHEEALARLAALEE